MQGCGICPDRCPVGLPRTNGFGGQESLPGLRALRRRLPDRRNPAWPKPDREEPFGRAVDPGLAILKGKAESG
ncbi:MAG TPA: hypothetical protein PLA83_00325 [Deltaproteobacteria bacterium]|nr:hypothetical protein [Deltaproteobacteria bacterium]HQI01937.1 hypothetical protein [Deltaproteobacteria bacterium]